MVTILQNSTQAETEIRAGSNICHVYIEEHFITTSEQSSSVRYSIAAVLLLFPFLTILCNSFMILAVITHKQLRTLSSAFVVSLAVADLLIAVLAMPFGVYQQFNKLVWDLGKNMCVLTTCFYVMLTTTSILNVCCLTVDRYLTICKPYLHQRMRIPNVALLLALCWILPVFISFLPIMSGWYHMGIQEYTDCTFSSKSLSYCFYIVNKPFAVVGSLLAFYGPAVCMLFCYVHIYISAKHHAREIYLHKKAVNQNPNLKLEIRAKKTIFAITGCFFVCWSPFYVLNVIDPFVNHQVPYTSWTVALWMGYANSIFNPILFCNYNTRYRKAIRRIVTNEICLGISEYKAEAFHLSTPTPKSSDSITRSISKRECTGLLIQGTKDKVNTHTEQNLTELNKSLLKVT